MLLFEVRQAYSRLNFKNLTRKISWDRENLYLFLQVNRQNLTIFHDLYSTNIDIINITGFDGID